MPLSALRHTPVDQRAPAAAIADWLAALAGRTLPRRVAEAGGRGFGRTAKPKEHEAVTEGYELKPPVALTCPGCGGAMAGTSEDSLPYFVCHTDHRYAADDMDEAQSRQMEGALEAALRSLNERAALCHRMAEAECGRGSAQVAKQWDAAKGEAEERIGAMRRFLEQSWRRPDPDENAPG